MRYPVAIELGNDTAAYGIKVPHLPGCFSAGNTIEEAMSAAEVAVAAWIEATLDAGSTVPPPSSIETLRERAEYKSWTFSFINVHPSSP